MRRISVLICAVILLSGCGGSGHSGGGGGPGGNDSPKDTCDKSNVIQRKATAAEAAIAAGSSDDLRLVSELGGAVLDAAHGVQHGTPEAADLNVVLADVDRLHTDLAGDTSKVPIDVGTLKNSLIKLGMDCSQVLTGG